MAVVFNDYMPTIWNRLMDEFHNEVGVAGVMGNLYAESGCTSYACQPSRPYDVCITYINNVNSHAISKYNFVHYGCSSTGGVANSQLGFGLAQWTYYTRKDGLYDFMFANGNDISDLENQIAYVIEEISNDSTMYNIVSTSTDINKVTDYILKHYENPKDQSYEVKKTRRGYATDIYNEYSGTTPIEPPDPQPPSPDTPIPKDEARGMPLWMMVQKRRYC